MTKGKGKKRHCMVVHAYYPLGETRVQREAIALRDRGYQVDVICLRGRGEAARECHDGVEVHRLPVGRHRGRGLAVQLLEYLVFFAMAAVRLSWLHLRRRYRSVQVHNLPDFLVFAAVFPKATGAPVILDLHDLMPEFFAARLGLTMDHPLVRMVLLQERMACRFADHVITVTEGWRETLAGRSVPMTRSTVVMNVADSALFRRETTEVVRGQRDVRDGLSRHLHPAIRCRPCHRGSGPCTRRCPPGATHPSRRRRHQV